MTTTLQKPSIPNLIPEAIIGSSRIEHFTLEYSRIMLDNMRYARDGMGFMQVEPGKYAKLVTSRGLEMSDTQMEWRTNRNFVQRAHGRVLIAGLGIGLVIVPLLKKKEVGSITVIELNQEVIDLVAPHIENKKLRVMQGDIFNHASNLAGKFDVIYFDIWPDINTDNLEEMTSLCRKYRKFLNKENPNAFMDCWTRDILRGLKRRGW